MANEEKSRRDFMGMALGACAAVGGVGALYAAKRSWDPLPSVKAAGFTTIDLSTAKPNELIVEKWRGKPIFILKKTEDMKPNDRDLIIGNDRFQKDSHTFFCACHGGVFDVSGVNEPGLPPPSPLEIPPYKIDGTKITLGEEGPEYKQMLAAGITV